MNENRTRTYVEDDLVSTTPIHLVKGVSDGSRAHYLKRVRITKENSRKTR